MTTMGPEDVAALFDLPPPLPDAAASTESALEVTDAAEAALAAEMAAELAATTGAMGVAADAPDSRTGRRVEVSWPARMRLPGGRIIALRVRDVSEAGVGLASEEPIPADTVVDLEMTVPPLTGSGGGTSVAAAIRTTYTVAQDSAILCGGTWMRLPPASRALVDGWIARLRG
ncbi:MAG: PilZ domain-containing protein [Burkholderiaceae bacterium]